MTSSLESVSRATFQTYHQNLQKTIDFQPCLLVAKFNLTREISSPQGDESRDRLVALEPDS
jgi:hypothetical protein